VVCSILYGSILGPVLFLLYINDLANISKKLRFILFADDTNVFYADKNLVDVMGVLNYELKNLSMCFKVNKLSLNVGKTNYIIFKRKSGNIDHKISIDGVHVERVHFTNLSGVKVDEIGMIKYILLVEICQNIYISVVQSETYFK